MAGRTYAAECGTLVVPENRAKSDSRRIALPVIRLRATTDTPSEPVFRLAGGPGLSNLKLKPPAWLLAGHDLIAVGYRGVDGSVVLDSPEVEQALRGVGRDLLGGESRANFGAAVRRCAARFEAEGVDLAGYTIPEVVADLEAARAALGYERVNLLSESYGTRVAQIYGHLHPERIHRSVMIGVNPPGRFVWEAQTIDAQLRYYARLCNEDRGCRPRTADLAETVAKVARTMPRRWLGVPIDPGKVRLVSFVLLFNRATAAMVFDAYLAAAAADPSGLALMSVASDFVLPRQFTWGDFFAKGASADLDLSRDYAAELDPPDSILGSPLSLIVFDGLSGDWPAHRIPPELRRVQPSNVETLLVSGSVDFSTPAELAANELLPSLTNGKHVVVAEAGHVADIWDRQPEATERLLTSFYDTGIADDSLYTYEPMSFAPSLTLPGPGRTRLEIPAGLPLLAKAIPAVGATFFLIGATSAWQAIRHKVSA